MVWLNIKIFFFLLFLSHNLLAVKLNVDEEMYFNFIDFNNDKQISHSEIEQSLRIIFQLVDLNRDGFISKPEINELKKIVDSLK